MTCQCVVPSLVGITAQTLFKSDYDVICWSHEYEMILCIHKCELGIFWSPAFLCAPSSCSSGRQWLAPVLLEGFGLKPEEQNQRIPYTEAIRPHMSYLSPLPSWVLRISAWLQQPIGRPQDLVSSLQFLHIWPSWKINKNWGNTNTLWLSIFVCYFIYQHWTLLSQVSFLHIQDQLWEALVSHRKIQQQNKIIGGKDGCSKESSFSLIEFNWN